MHIPAPLTVGVASLRGVARRAGVVAALVSLTLCARTSAQPSPKRPVDVPAAGDYRIVHWTTAEGLPQGTINDILVLDNGELWLATFGGLARFDGHSFHVLDIASDEGLPANRIVSLAVAGPESFWFLTQQGHLGRVDRGRSETLVAPPGAVLDTLSLSVDRDGAIYCAAVDGSVWRTDGAQTWSRVLPASRTGAVSHAFASTRDRQTWTSWGDRLLRLVGADQQQSMALPEAAVDIFAGLGDELWLGLTGRVASIAGGRLDVADARPEVRGKVLAIAVASPEQLWIGAGSEVSRLDRHGDGTWHRVVLPLDVPAGRRIRTLLLDSRGSLWIGTDGAGLYRVHRPAARRVGKDQGLGDVTALASDGSGGALIGAGCAGLLHLDAAGSLRPVALQDPADRATSDEKVCAISLGATGTREVWARALSSLFLVDAKSLEVSRVPLVLPAVEGPVAVNTDGTAWVLSRNGGVLRVAPDGTVQRRLELPAPLMSAARGPADTLWVGGDGAVYQVEGDIVRRFGPAEGVPRGLIRDLLPEADGTVWIGSYGGGLGRLRDGRVVRFAAGHGLPDNSISRLLDDGRGRMWISTNRGVAVVSLGELRAAGGPGPAIAPVVLGPERGMSEANFGSPAGFVDANGQVWLGTIEGVAVIDAARFPFNLSPPRVQIEHVVVDQRRHAAIGTVSVPSTASRVRVAFSAPELLHAEQLRFRFWVEGNHHERVDLGSARAFDWTPPAPGRHRLLVEARNEDGLWSDPPTAVVVDVLPAWYQGALFRWAAVVVTLVVLYGGFRLRVHTIERRHGAELRRLEERRQAEQRIAGLRTQLEHVSRVALAGELAASLAHEVGQPLGAIVNNAEAGRRHLRQYLDDPHQISAIFDDIVSDGLRASEVVKGLRGFLRPRMPESADVDLSSVVREMLPLLRRELDHNQVQTELALSDTLPPVQGYRAQLGQVVVNLVLNACEALSGTTGVRRLDITTAERDGHVELSVRDNGPGFAPEVAARVFEPFVTTKAEGLGMGLAICRGIANAHHGRLQARPVPSGGVEVTMSLPVASTRSLGR